MKVEIVDKGLFSLIVDNGRVGRQRDGFSQSGPMDEDAFLWANFLAFNLDNTPCIEAMGTLTARFSSHCIIAVTGRAVKVTINGHEQQVMRVYMLLLAMKLPLAVNIWEVKHI